MSRLFGYTAAVADRNTAAIEVFENKKIEAQVNYRYGNVYILLLYVYFYKL